MKEIFNELKNITDEKEQIMVMKQINEWYDECKGHGPYTPETKKELKEFINKCLKENSHEHFCENYGSLVFVRVEMMKPCMLLNLHDQTFIGGYNEIIKQFEQDIRWIYTEREANTMLEETGMGECLNEIKIKKFCEQYDVTNDTIKFFKNLGYYDILNETELACGPLTEEANKALIEIEKIAQKYKLYNDQQACDDEWYHDYTLIPKMKKFFREILYKKAKIEKMNKKEND